MFHKGIREFGDHSDLPINIIQNTAADAKGLPADQGVQRLDRLSKSAQIFCSLILMVDQLIVTKPSICLFVGFISISAIPKTSCTNILTAGIDTSMSK